MTTHTQKKAGANRSTVAPAICLSGINKRFGSVQANQDIDLVVKAGTIHGIIGENGAGKSTLVSILYGFYTADKGQITIDGQKTDLRHTADAISAGIGMVHQHFMLVPNFTVLENIILGNEGKGGLVSGKAQARLKLESIAETYGLQVDLDAFIHDLPVGLQQRVEILKALYRGARILILDEPTGVLTPQETDQLFKILSVLREQGVSILLITHKLREIMAITDNVSVMRAGKMVAHLKTGNTNAEHLAELMVGRPVLLSTAYTRAEPKQICLHVNDLSFQNAAGKDCLKNISFSVHKGEIFGIAGVSGNGQSELLEILAGIQKMNQGHIQIGDQEISAQHPLSPAQIKNLGIAHIPEDRHAVGLVLPFSAAESAILGYERQHASGFLGWWLKAARIFGYCQKIMAEFDIRPAHPELKCNLFSGGNQQKIVVARELSAQPDILLVGQPTRGVDIGAIESIHKQLLDMRDKGCAIILVSVELDEILNLSDRIMVMNNGQNMGIVDKHNTNAHHIGMLMAGLSGPDDGMLQEQRQ